MQALESLTPLKQKCQPGLGLFVSSLSFAKFWIPPKAISLEVLGSISAGSARKKVTFFGSTL